MKKTFALTAAAALALGGIHANGATLNTVGVYDENTTQTNTIEKSASGTNTITAATFTSLVATAFAANLGGVIDFDTDGSDSGTAAIAGTTLLNANGSSFTASYGVTQANSLTITKVSGLGGMSFPTGALQLETRTTGDRISISKSLTGSNFNRLELSFDIGLTAFGVTVLSREGSGFDNPNAADRNVTLTVTYNDLTTASATANINESDAGSVAGQDDTFFGFQAPTGKTISSVLIDYGSATVGPGTGPNFTDIDDIGFIVVPEPTTFAMLLGGAGLLLMRRRRRG